MSSSSDDDLPDVANFLSLPESPSKNRVSYKIDLTREVQLKSRFLQLKELRRQEASEENSREEVDKILQEKCQEEIINSLPQLEDIPDEAPGRDFILPEAAFRQFNAESLVKPDLIQHANHHDLLQFYQFTRNVLLDLTTSRTAVEDYQSILRYLLFLASVHRDEFIVEACVELLLEFNTRWEVNHKLLLAVFQNWGADINQVLPSYPPIKIRVTPEIPQTVPFFNVNAVLQVLTAQLKYRKRLDVSSLTADFGLWSIDELIFSLLVLLSLDAKYVECIPLLQECVAELLTGVSENTGGSWASDYSQLLMGTEENNYNLTQLVCRVLIGCPACEALQLNVAFAAVQRIRGVAPAQIKHVFEYNRFEDLIRETTKLASHQAKDVYCLLIFIDSIVRHNKVTSEERLRSFSKWLNRLDSKVERNSHVCAQVSILRTVWGQELFTAE